MVLTRRPLKTNGDNPKSFYYLTFDLILGGFFFGPTRLTLIEFPVRLTNQPCVLNDCELKLEKSLGSLNGIRSDLRYASTTGLQC